jgi:hypothetical protein
MIAVAKQGKVRIVMDLSRPEGLSFNDNIDEKRIEKISTASETGVGFTILECGKGARIWKFDLANAFKNIPAKPEDLRLQGFRWLGMFFVETQQVFGAKTAAFGRLGGTLAGLAAVKSGCPRRWIHRTIDDTVLVTPADSAVGPAFAAAYKDICADLGVILAENCPACEKAFKDQTQGTVLGVRFDTVKQTRSMAPEKLDSIITAATPGLRRLHMSLSETQTLLGKLANFCHMCKFLKAFKHPLNNFLASFRDDTQLMQYMTDAEVADLHVWAQAVTAAAGGLPIPGPSLPPTATALTFVSDATGASFANFKGSRVPVFTAGDRGAASVGVNTDGSYWFAATITWPRSFIFSARDSKKTVFLAANRRRWRR